MASAQSHDTLANVCGDCHVEKYASCGGFLEGPSVSPSGAVYAVDVLGDRIVEATSSGACATKLKTDGHPNGSKFRTDGRLLVADWKGLYLYAPHSNTIEDMNLVFDGKPITDINDLVLDSMGGIYFTVPKRSSLVSPDGMVFYRSPSGEIREIAHGLAFPNGIAVTSDGEAVLIAEFAAKRILSVPAVTAKNPLATSYVFAFTEGGIGCDGMTLDAKGRLFCANFGAGEVLVFDRKAHKIGAITLPEGAHNLVTNVAIGNGYLYMTEGQSGDIWRVRLTG